MTDSALQRTIRRCVAVLVIPVSAHLGVLTEYVSAVTYVSADWAATVSLLLFFGSVAYLAGSIFLQVWRSQSGPAEKQTTAPAE